MSGTGQFRSARGGRIGAFSVLAREHLGNRLAAFVDGELGDDARDRVLSHLASCDPCRAEAEEQRRLKNAVADSLPPALSAGLLARLQGLPGCDHDDLSGPGPDTPLGLFGRGGPGRLGGPDSPSDDSRGGGRLSFLTPGEPLAAGFPIHEFGRSASRGRRLAFAAAGAFSLAALAIGASLPLDGVSGPAGQAEPAPGSATSPLGMRQVADQHTAGAGESGTSWAPAVADRSLPSAQAGAPRLGATASAVPAAASMPGAGTPGPSALPLAPWTAPAPLRAVASAPAVSAAPAHATSSPAPTPSAPVTAPPVPTVLHATPVPLPMTGDDQAVRLARPPFGGHPY